MSIADMLRKLNLKPTGGNHRHIKSKLTLHEIDTGHFTGSNWSKGKKLGENFYNTQLPLNKILVKNSSYNSDRLKKRLILAGMKEEKCEKCGLTHWQNKKLPLEMHHINGSHNDNRLANLQILCPNCHSVIDKPEQPQ